MTPMEDAGRGLTDSEHLMQRFIDQELSAEERMRFVARLGRDAELRRQTIEMEQLLIDVGRLPRPIVADGADGFVARVMARTAAPVAAEAAGALEVAGGPSFWRHAADLFFAPRVLHWRPASAIAVMALVAAGAVAAAQMMGIGTPRASDSAAIPAASNVAPVLIRLVVMEPGATTVQVAGDFNGWNPERTPLEQLSNGAWAVTLPLEPGRYEYMFVVDGARWVSDPFAVELSDDGFGARNAVLDVRRPSGTQS
jgi:hypothetical protein